MGCCSVAKGYSLRKVITSALLALFKASIIESTKPTQFGSRQKLGGSQLVFSVQLMLEAKPSLVCVSLDIENAFNDVKRSVILKKLWRDPRLRELWYYFW